MTNSNEQPGALGYESAIRKERRHNSNGEITGTVLVDAAYAREYFHDSMRPSR